MGLKTRSREHVFCFRRWISRGCDSLRFNGGRTVPAPIVFYASCSHLARDVEVLAPATAVLSVAPVRAVSVAPIFGVVRRHIARVLECLVFRDAGRCASGRMKVSMCFPCRL